MIRQIYFPAAYGQESTAQGAQGAAGAADPSAVINAITAGAYAVGNLIDQGMTSEYKPDRRMTRIQNNLPKFIGHMKTLNNVAKHARDKGRDDLASKVLNNRPLNKPLPVPPFIGPAQIKTGDTASMTVANDMLAQKANSRQPGSKRLPITFDGGNLKMVREAAQLIFNEALLFSATPESVALQDPDLLQAKNRALTVVNAVLLDPTALRLLYPGDAEAAEGRVPKVVRDQILDKYLQWAALGLIPANLPMPSWLYSFRADGSDAPLLNPTLGAYVVASTAVGQGQLNDENLRRLYGAGAAEVASS